MTFFFYIRRKCILYLTQILIVFICHILFIAFKSMIPEVFSPCHIPGRYLRRKGPAVFFRHNRCIPFLFQTDFIINDMISYNLKVIAIRPERILTSLTKQPRPPLIIFFKFFFSACHISPLFYCPRPSV